jgi:hypothetical protein
MENFAADKEAKAFANVVQVDGRSSNSEFRAKLLHDTFSKPKKETTWWNKITDGSGKEIAWQYRDLFIDTKCE